MADKAPSGRILVVDDEASLREVLTIMLQREGYDVETAADGATAQALLRESDFDLIISDIKMPKITGLELLRFVREHAPETMMIMITAFSTSEDAVEAMKLGAFDYITKPFRNDEIRLIVRNALERRALRQENQTLRQELSQRYSFANMVGKSEPMQQVYELISKVAPSKANVLVTGESGTGKELVAKAIHFNSPRRDHPFVPVNCGAIPETLLESELFGHEKGAFTGASGQKAGLFEVANSGTIFLDEIGELPASMQVKLLRVLQEREFRRVGGTKDLPVDVRLIAATNKDLATETKEGRFREDLYYRLNVIHIPLPPLRERSEDIPLLINHFYQSHAGHDVKISDAALRLLLDYPWPGNIRELHNVLERCLVLGSAESIGVDCLPPQVRDAAAGTLLHDLPEDGLDLDAYLAAIERELLLKALERSNNVRTRAAELLKMSFRSIRYRLAKFGLDVDE
ncbi:MAG: Fis family transcriptional regulator [Deltaproteobacteria bacterium HGW-Deltaproteobacteria-4]|nr:MAG: Fis family transcriptional regulator [Deltaproteobacteria bacterium HGW-Deltaproteobacteria-4]